MSEFMESRAVRWGMTWWSGLIILKMHSYIGPWAFPFQNYAEANQGKENTERKEGVGVIRSIVRQRDIRWNFIKQTMLHNSQNARIRISLVSRTRRDRRHA